jgi:hypothetical protein
MGEPGPVKGVNDWLQSMLEPVGDSPQACMHLNEMFGYELFLQTVCVRTRNMRRTESEETRNQLIVCEWELQSLLTSGLRQAEVGFQPLPTSPFRPRSRQQCRASNIPTSEDDFVGSTLPCSILITLCIEMAIIAKAGSQYSHTLSLTVFAVLMMIDDRV